MIHKKINLLLFVFRQKIYSPFYGRVELDVFDGNARLKIFCFACTFDEYLWRSYVYRTTFYNAKYQDLCSTINPLKIKDLQKLKTISKYLCNNNLIGFLQKPD